MQPWEASQHPRVTHISPAPRKLSSTAALCPCTELISKLLIIKVRPGTSWLPLGTLPYNQDILIPRFLYPHLSHSLFLTQGGLPNTKGTWVHSQATVMSGSPPCGGNDHPTPPPTTPVGSINCGLVSFCFQLGRERISPGGRGC